MFPNGVCTPHTFFFDVYLLSSYVWSTAIGTWKNMFLTCSTKGFRFLHTNRLPLFDVRQEKKDFFTTLVNFLCHKTRKHRPLKFDYVLPYSVPLCDKDEYIGEPWPALVDYFDDSYLFLSTLIIHSYPVNNQYYRPYSWFNHNSDT